MTTFTDLGGELGRHTQAIESKPHHLRRAEIQIQLMERLGYALIQGNDKNDERDLQNLSVVEQWSLSGLAENFATYWKSESVQKLLASNAPDKEFIDLLDPLMRNLVPSEKFKRLQVELWPQVEDDLIRRLNINTLDHATFVPLRSRWESLFNDYLREILRNEHHKTLPPDDMARLIAQTIINTNSSY